MAIIHFIHNNILINTYTQHIARLSKEITIHLLQMVNEGNKQDASLFSSLVVFEICLFLTEINKN